MLRFPWISPSPINKGNEETFPPNGNYLVSVTDFLLFTAPVNEPTSVLSFNQSFALSQIRFSRSLRLFFILSFPGGGGWNRARSLVRCDSLPLPQDILNHHTPGKNREVEVRNNTSIGPMLSSFYFENIFVLYFILLWRAVWRLTPSLIRFLHVV